MLSEPSERLREPPPSCDVSRELLSRALEASPGLLKRSTLERGATEERRDPWERPSKRLNLPSLSLRSPHSTERLKRERLPCACPALGLLVIRLRRERCRGDKVRERSRRIALRERELSTIEDWCKPPGRQRAREGERLPRIPGSPPSDRGARALKLQRGPRRVRVSKRPEASPSPRMLTLSAEAPSCGERRSEGFRINREETLCAPARSLKVSGRERELCEGHRRRPRRLLKGDRMLCPAERFGAPLEIA